ncbi:MAG: hypothetical protein CVV24_06670 [Ignavibacteriae bacterium HGW-Ignavibacteriae-3]|nr:MAG: hypothetical protein CVV24_06670 [Ignavibacteriae bacterium HGW-Ignavibacteriae-3]
MHAEELIDELRNHGDKRAVSIRQKQGFNTENYLGVDVKKIAAIAKKVKKNHKLADQLRKSGIHDAILLSFFIDEPKKISVQEAKNIIRQIDFPELTDSFCAHILINSPHIYDLIDEWKDSSREMIKRSAYMGVHELARNNRKLEDDYFWEFMDRIEKEIGFSKNWIKDAMAHALISIANRTEKLKNKAAAVVKNIGKIKIEYPKGSRVAPAPLKEFISGLQSKNS